MQNCSGFHQNFFRSPVIYIVIFVGTISQYILSERKYVRT